MAYDTITNPMATMSGDAGRVSEDRNYAAIGKRVAEQAKMDKYAAPLAEQAWKQGKMDGATELVARIEAQRAAQMARQQPVGLAGYLNEQEGLYNG